MMPLINYAKVEVWLCMAQIVLFFCPENQAYTQMNRGF
jgi:hypothetical protein